MFPEMTWHHWFLLGVSKLYHLWRTGFHQPQGLTSFRIHDCYLCHSINNGWNPSAINPHRHQHGIPTRILKHELPDRLTESRFRPRLRLPGGRCGAITCTYRTVRWSVSLPRTGEALLRLRTFPSKMSRLATIVASPPWWRWPAAVSGRWCWAVVPRLLRRSRRRHLTLKQCVRQQLDDALLFFCQPSGLTVRWSTWSWLLIRKSDLAHRNWRSPENTQVGQGLPHIWQRIVDCVRVLFWCCIGRCSILATSQEAFRCNRLKSFIRNVWICLRRLDQDTIHEVLQWLSLLLLDCS